MKPLISILQDIDRDANVRVVMRSFQLDEYDQTITVAVESRKDLNHAWGAVLAHTATFSDAFKALSWATIALEKALAMRGTDLFKKGSIRNLKPFQQDSEEPMNPE